MLCGEDLNGPGGYVRSPGYASGEYPPNHHCVYYIYVEPDHVISLDFLDFQLGNVNNCTGDFLQV